MKKVFFILLVVVIALGAGYFVYSKNSKVSSSPTPTPTPTATPSESVSPSASPSFSPSPSVSASPTTSPKVSPMAGATVKQFNITASSFKFSPVEIKVKLGDKVKIVLANQGGMHDWVLDEFNARTKQLQSGQSDTIEFTASKKGTFEYYCSVGTHRQMGMKGNLIVE